MNTNQINSVPFLRTSREFPAENQEKLVLQISKMYLDVANVVNSRTIGVHTKTKPSFTGEAFYLEKNIKQQGYRQIYTFTGTGPIAHNLNFSQISYFTNCYGSYLDNTGKWNGLIFASSTAIAGQVSFNLTSTNIVIQAGAGAPTISKGIVVLQWIDLA